MIEVRSVSAGYVGSDVVKDISFSVDGGELYILIGPNGAGKTTVFRIAAGILPPTGGDVLIDGISIWERVEVRAKIGYLPEGERVYPDLTVFKNLQLFARIYRRDERRIVEILREFELYEYRDKMAGTLSRGLRKRLALARAMLHDPEILILDEPFSNLDVNSVMAIREKIVRMLEQGKAILFSTHILDELYSFEGLKCRVAVLKDGRISIEDNMHVLMDVGEVLLKVSDPVRAAKILEDRGLNFSLKSEGLIISPKTISEAIKILVNYDVAVVGINYIGNPLEKYFKN